ncbi:protein SRG1 isoform X1 [Jatropha curcas]|uniref:protein SRG1 isoform X1 n=1 Tax=Jatropha curcas TaxID=180498 RepID=UPI0009D66299|nr:protein SRG1 isoform X1 [Jatropha curcas]
MESSSLEAVNFGRSIIVPSVQNLVEKESLVKIPPRYARSEQDCPIISSDGSLTSSVPVIDLQKLVAGDSIDSESKRLDAACREWGFFQIVNHGVDTNLLEDFKLETKNFFKLPYEEKKKLWQQPDNHEGFGQLFVVSEEQKLDWSDMFYVTTLPQHLRKVDLFDKLPLSLSFMCRESLETYGSEMRKLAMAILCHMAKALKMDVEEMKELFSDGVQSMRMNYYPPCPEPEKAIGFTPHSDADALTILLQLNETEGLQIRKDGKWIPVKPLPNAFVVNIGDIMQIVSNCVYRSIEHRATVNSAKERLSVATFYSSKLDSVLGPATSLIGPHNPAVFRQVPVEKYFKEFFARKLNGKSYLDFMRIQGQ